MEDLTVQSVWRKSHTLRTSTSACMHHTGNGTVCTGQIANEQCHAMQMERSIYDAASRAIQHQRNPDGSVKQDAMPAEPAVHDAASTSQPAGVIKPDCVDPRLLNMLSAFIKV